MFDIAFPCGDLPTSVCQGSKNIVLYQKQIFLAARKAKANLQDFCVPKLEKLARRGKSLSKEAIDDRAQKVTANEVELLGLLPLCLPMPQKPDPQ